MSGISLQRREMGQKFLNFVHDEMINLPITALKYSLPTSIKSSNVNTPKIA